MKKAEGKRMKIRKLITCFTALAVASGMFAACGDSKTSADNGEAAEGGAGAQEILLWSSATGPDGERIQKTIDAYNATNPDYKVKFVSMQADTFNTKLSTAGRSGKGVPDLALVASEALPTYQSQEMLVSWDEVIAGTELKRENYYILLTLVVWKQKIIMLRIRKFQHSITI